MAEVSGKVRSEDVAPEMRAALKRVGDRLDVGHCVKGSEDLLTLVGENKVELARSGPTRQWFAGVVGVPDLLALFILSRRCVATS